MQTHRACLDNLVKGQDYHVQTKIARDNLVL